MEAPIEKGLKPKKTTYEHRLKLTKTVFQVIAFVRKQTPVKSNIFCLFLENNYFFITAVS
jgi:hypothetical protein